MSVLKIMSIFLLTTTLMFAAEGGKKIATSGTNGDLVIQLFGDGDTHQVEREHEKVSSDSEEDDDDKDSRNKRKLRALVPIPPQAARITTEVVDETESDGGLVIVSLPVGGVEQVGPVSFTLGSNNRSLLKQFAQATLQGGAILVRGGADVARHLAMATWWAAQQSVQGGRSAFNRIRSGSSEVPLAIQVFGHSMGEPGAQIDQQFEARVGAVHGPQLRVVQVGNHSVVVSDALLAGITHTQALVGGRPETVISADRAAMQRAVLGSERRLALPAPTGVTEVDSSDDEA